MSLYDPILSICTDESDVEEEEFPLPPPPEHLATLSLEAQFKVRDVLQILCCFVILQLTGSDCSIQKGQTMGVDCTLCNQPGDWLQLTEKRNLPGTPGYFYTG